MVYIKITSKRAVPMQTLSAKHVASIQNDVEPPSRLHGVESRLQALPETAQPETAQLETAQPEIVPPVTLERAEPGTQPQRCQPAWSPRQLAGSTTGKAAFRNRNAPAPEVSPLRCPPPPQAAAGWLRDGHEDS